MVHGMTVFRTIRITTARLPYRHLMSGIYRPGSHDTGPPAFPQIRGRAYDFLCPESVSGTNRFRSMMWNSDCNGLPCVDRNLKLSNLPPPFSSTYLESGPFVFCGDLAEGRCMIVVNVSFLKCSRIYVVCVLSSSPRVTIPQPSTLQKHRKMLTDSNSTNMVRAQ